MSDFLPVDAAQIKNLLQLQEIDRELYAIEEKKGDLPAVIRQLFEDKQSLEERIKQKEADLKAIKQAIQQEKGKGKEATARILEYEQQQLTVENTEEFEQLSKNIDYERLEEQLSKKRIKEHQQTLEDSNEEVGSLQTALREKEAHIQSSQEKLDKIQEVSSARESQLKEQRAKSIKKIATSLYKVYEELYARRKNVVARVINGACQGCNLTVPDQTQIEIKAQKRLYTCETCGRMLLEVEEEPIAPTPRARVRGQA